MIIVDTHGHLYPCHDARAWLNHARANLRALAGGAEAALAVCLAERYDCHAHRDLRAGRVPPPAGAEVRAGAEAETLFLGDGGGELALFAGRQVVTRERIEVLALLTAAGFPDGEPLADTLARVRDAGAIPALSWAPGKWLFGRGRRVRAAAEAAQAGELFLGDTTLRPAVWPEPALMREAAARGLRVLAGSDPLPFAGEERRAGTYATVLDGAWDPARPAAALRRMLQDPAVPVRRAGARGRLLEVVQRLDGNRRAKKRGG